ncbi:uncharacterized protein PAC_12862 [Phialocephala subalpina]|uniref:Glycosyltransferase family 2 protein n=1 Tax=Phialocephala subalpina TaxID=576137 RepID=A0A1L7XD58_9HELO|nr:uncharacterized protein PAC_12862 [Phialocephala subalpina]
MSGVSFPTNVLQWIYVGISSATVVRLWDGRPNVLGGALSVTGFVGITLLGVVWIFLREFFTVIINILNWLLSFGGNVARIPAFEYWLGIYENLDQSTFIVLVLLICLCVAVATHFHYMAKTRRGRGILRARAEAPAPTQQPIAPAQQPEPAPETPPGTPPLVFVGKPTGNFFKGSLPSSPTQLLDRPQAPISTSNSPKQVPMTPPAATRAAGTLKIPAKRPDGNAVHRQFSPLILSPTSWIAQDFVNPIVDRIRGLGYKIFGVTAPGSPRPTVSRTLPRSDEHDYTSDESDSGNNGPSNNTPRPAHNIPNGTASPVKAASSFGLMKAAFLLFVFAISLVWYGTSIWDNKTSIFKTSTPSVSSASVSPISKAPTTFHIEWPEDIQPSEIKVAFETTTGSEHISVVEVKESASAAPGAGFEPTPFEGKSPAKISAKETSSTKDSASSAVEVSTEAKSSTKEPVFSEEKVPSATKDQSSEKAPSKDTATSEIPKVSTSSKRSRVAWGKKTSQTPEVSKEPLASTEKASSENVPTSDPVKSSGSSLASRITHFLTRKNSTSEVKTQSGSKLDTGSVNPPTESDRVQDAFKKIMPSKLWSSMWGTATQSSSHKTSSAKKAPETTSDEASPSSQSATSETAASKRSTSGKSLAEILSSKAEASKESAEEKVTYGPSTSKTSKVAAPKKVSSAEKKQSTSGQEPLPEVVISEAAASKESAAEEKVTVEPSTSTVATSKGWFGKPSTSEKDLAELLSSKAAASQKSVVEEDTTYGPSTSKTTTSKKVSAAKKKASVEATSESAASKESTSEKKSTSLPSTSKAASKQSTAEKEASVEATSDIKSVEVSSATQASESEAVTSPPATTPVTPEYHGYVDTYQPLWDRWLWPNAATKSRPAKVPLVAQASQIESGTSSPATTQGNWWNEENADIYEPAFHQSIKSALESIKKAFHGPDPEEPCSATNKRSCGSSVLVNAVYVASIFIVAIFAHYITQFVRGVAPTPFGVFSSILMYQPVFWGIIFSLGRFMPFPFGYIVSQIQYHWYNNRLFVYFLILASIKAFKGFVHIISYYFYTRPAKSPLSPTVTPDDVTVIVPSIGDFGEDFQVTIKTILANKPKHLVIATVDVDMVKKLKSKVLDTLPRAIMGNTKITIDMTMVSNKRSQFLSAVNQSETSIVCYADDHVVWPATFLKSALAPFEDPHTGMVGTVKAVERVRNKGVVVSFLNYIGCIYLERHNFECTATHNIDGGVFVISGRTGLIRREILANLDFRTGMLNEYFKFGPLKATEAMKPDDDNYMTRYCLRNGWKTVFHNDPLACIGTSIGVDEQDGSVTKKFTNQLVRWARTTWRSNLVSLFQDRICWKVHPWTTYAMFISSFINLAIIYDPLMLAFLYFSCATTSQHFCGAVFWLFLSKLVKPLQHMFREPKDIIWLPFGIFFGYLHSGIRLYALFTMTNVGWGGRTIANHGAAAPAAP